MIITQIVEIPESREIILKVPREIPAGLTKIIVQFPIKETSVKETAAKRRMTEAEEMEYINNNIEWLTKEALDNLSYQNLALDDMEE
ncbi:MAG: hypothetical protein FWD78_03150 [Treponema sp.]|nr:hypothetical protein [Treponema sp.]